ncbi:hypothetical protein ACSNOI_40045 [Actinomadura kijaniata]|uniref:hypothetical protein n=1 Tax=Actinomadura kijaniata TaxID=46161 RepID=UPI003F1B3CA6
MNTRSQPPCGHTHFTKYPLPPEGAWARLGRRWRERLPVERVVHRDHMLEFVTPAQGDGYEFTVKVQFTWCATGKERTERLAERAWNQAPALRDRLITRLRPVSRRFAPYEAADAETRIIAAVEELFAQTYFDHTTAEGFNGRTRAIEPMTFIRLDDTVREAQRRAWDERQTADNAHALAERLVPQLTRRRDLWHEFLRSGQGSWITPYAVALTVSPERAAEVVRKMFEERREQAGELAEEIADQAQEYSSMNAFELMMRNDTVLQRLMDLMGIDRPPELTARPFDDSDRALWNGGPRG